MPSLKEFKNKLKSLHNMRKMTKTMKMVAASKLYRTMDDQRRASVFATRLQELIARLTANVDAGAHPLLERREEVRNVLVLFSAGFNNNLIKLVSKWLAMPAPRTGDAHFSFCGRRGHLFFRSRQPVKTYYEGVTHRPTFNHAIRIAHDVCQDFLSGEFDEVYIAYNHFGSPLSQTPVLDKLLPLEPHEDFKVGHEALHALYLLEPPEDELLSLLLPRIVEHEIYFALLENAAGENGARMTAMDNATRNADKMINQYTLLRNRARQASITKELIEIISGAEALKG
jgi:F-type H+-transporting ATPase subunit gamma